MIKKRSKLPNRSVVRGNGALVRYAFGCLAAVCAAALGAGGVLEANEPIFMPPPLTEPSRDSTFRDPAQPSDAQTATRALERLQISTTLQPPLELLPEGYPTEDSNRGFPELPPDPDAEQHLRLPPLDEELWNHGGSYLYQPEGDRLNWPSHEQAHYDLLRLPESWQKPEPFTAFSPFLGTGFIASHPSLRWLGPSAYAWDPQLVLYGEYDLFGLSFEQDNLRRDAVGHQLFLELDLRLTGTERFHVQWRPLGEGNSGGSFYQFNDPSGYVDNSTGVPTRYWFEAELHSLFGSYVDSFAALDYNLVVGKFPFALHNTLLMNDEILGVAISKNTIYLGSLSNLNVQTFYAFDDVGTDIDRDNNQLLGLHLSADHRHVFYEATYAFLDSGIDSTSDSHYAALSRTAWYGRLSLATRALFKMGDEAGSGSGELFVIESNFSRVFEQKPLGIEHAVYFCNAFVATEGWTPIAGANFNRLRTAFEVNPLIRLSAAPETRDTAGVALGVQLFRRHDDESFIPEVAFEAPGGEPVWGVGLRYFRKTGPRTFLEVLGVANFSDDPQFDREGVFLSHGILW